VHLKDPVCDTRYSHTDTCIPGAFLSQSPALVEKKNFQRTNEANNKNGRFPNLCAISGISVPNYYLNYKSRICIGKGQGPAAKAFDSQPVPAKAKAFIAAHKRRKGFSREGLIFLGAPAQNYEALIVG